MDVWPIEEQWLRPLVTLALCAAAPWLAGAVITRVVQSRPRLAWAIALPALALAAAAIGATALGPVWTTARWDQSAWLFGGLSVLILLVSAAIHATLRPLRATRGAAAPALVTGAVLSVVTATLVFLPNAVTLMEADAAHGASADAARWRLRVDPWDGGAMLAWAWSARRREDHELALARLAEARRMHVPEAPSLELEAELAASRGECPRADELFEASLRERARAALDGEAPLELGGYHLPPALVQDCPELTLPAALQPPDPPTRY